MKAIKVSTKMPKFTKSNKEKIYNLSKTHKMELSANKWDSHEDKKDNDVFITYTLWFVNKETGNADYYLDAGKEIIEKNI